METSNVVDVLVPKTQLPFQISRILHRSKWCKKQRYGLSFTSTRRHPHGAPHNPLYIYASSSMASAANPDAAIFTASGPEEGTSVLGARGARSGFFSSSFLTPRFSRSPRSPMFWYQKRNSRFKSHESSIGQSGAKNSDTAFHLHLRVVIPTAPPTTHFTSTRRHPWRARRTRTRRSSLLPVQKRGRAFWVHEAPGPVSSPLPF